MTKINQSRFLKRWNAFRNVMMAVCLLGMSSYSGNAQCYQPITGPDVSVGILSNAGGVCITQICLGSSYQNLQLAIDNDLESGTEWGNLVTALNAQTLVVKKSSGSFPAGYIAGFVLSKSDLASLALFNDISISTYNGGVLQETRVSASLLSGSLLSGEKTIFTTFKTTQPFDEIRLHTGTLSVSVLGDLTIRSAVAFDPDGCSVENNAICQDHINGPGTYVTFNANVTSLLNGLTNPERLVDGDKTNYAVFNTGVAGLLANAYVGILDTRQVYPAGNRAGIIVEPEASLLSVGVLNSMKVATYLYGEFQEEASFSNGTGGLLNLALLDNSASKKQKLSFTTTKEFNEVRLVITDPVNINTGNLRIYGAFEEPATCTECEETLLSTKTGKYKGSIPTGNTPDHVIILNPQPWNGLFGLGLPVGAQINNVGNLIDANESNYATVVIPIVNIGLGNGARITVQSDGSFPGINSANGRTFAGFTIEKTTGILEVGLLGGITIKAYNNGTLVGQSSGASLLSGALLGGSLNKTTIGFYPNNDFNRIVIDFDFGVLGVALFAGDYRVYNAFVIEDDDEDGVPNCIDMCSTGDDNIDTDGDGIPDACDAPLADIVTVKELNDPAQTSFTGGDDVVYKITVTNNGPEAAENVKVTDIAPAGTTITNWTATATSGLTLPGTSGSSDLDQTIVTFPVGETVTYTVTVSTSPAYLAENLSNTVSVTSDTEDPDPNCARCTTPGLPRLIADLVPSIVMFDQTFHAGSLEKPFTIRVNNLVAGNTSAENISLFINAAPYFSFELQPASEINWDLNDDIGYEITSKPGVRVSNGTPEPIDLIVKALPGTPKGIYSYTVSIITGSGGEINNTNNTAVRFIIVQ